MNKAYPRANDKTNGMKIYMSNDPASAIVADPTSSLSGHVHMDLVFPDSPSASAWYIHAVGEVSLRLDVRRVYIPKSFLDPTEILFGHAQACVVFDVGDEPAVEGA